MIQDLIEELIALAIVSKSDSGFLGGMEQLSGSQEMLKKIMFPL